MEPSPRSTKKPRSSVLRVYGAGDSSLDIFRGLMVACQRASRHSLRRRVAFQSRPALICRLRNVGSREREIPAKASPLSKRDGYSWTRQVGRGAASFAIPEGVSLVRPACNSPHRPGADRVPSCQKNAARRRAGHFLRATSGSKAKTVSEFQLPFRIRRAARLVGSASGESVRALTLLRRSVSSLASTGMVSATNAASHERDRQLMARHGRG